MKSIEISASLPFSWCRHCFGMDMQTEGWGANGQVKEIENVCANAAICEACERARVSEKLEKEDPFAKACTAIGMNQGAERKELGENED